MDFSRDMQMLEKIGQDWRDHMSDTGGVRQTTSEEDERRQHFYDSLTTETSLQQHLMEQAELADCPPPVQEALRYLVGSLDDRGYLTSSLSDIALLATLPLPIGLLGMIGGGATLVLIPLAWLHFRQDLIELTTAAAADAQPARR